jgi:hypothetical protein
VGFDYSIDETVEDRVFESIMDVLEDDAKTEDRLSREAERLVQQQSHIAKASGKSLDDLVDEVKSRLAKAKRVTLGDGPDRADTLAEKVFKAIWNVEGIDFFSDDTKVQNCIARAIHRFRHDDERMIDTVERLADRKTNEERYTAPWCLAYDRYLSEVKQKLAAVHSTTAEAKTASPL